MPAGEYPILQPRRGGIGLFFSILMSSLRDCMQLVYSILSFYINTILSGLFENNVCSVINFYINIIPSGFGCL